MDAFARGERHRAAGAARELATLAGLHRPVVDDRADRDVAQRHGVARLDRRIRSGAQLIPWIHALGGQYVAALAVRVLHQSDVARAVRIVLQALHDSGNAVLVTLEIDDAVLLTRAAADVARGDAAGVVASAGLVLRASQRQVRTALVQVLVVDLYDRAGPRWSAFGRD